MDAGNQSVSKQLFSFLVFLLIDINMASSASIHSTINISFKSTNCRPKTCGIWHYTYYNVKPGYSCQTTVILGIMKDGSLFMHSLASFNFFQNSLSKWHRWYVKNGQHGKRLLCSSDHPILFFHQLVIKIFIKELQKGILDFQCAFLNFFHVLFLSFNASNSNGYMEELERKI